MDDNRLAKEIPRTVREFRFGNMILKITKSQTGSVGMMIKNEEWENEHYMFVFNKEQASMHHTKERFQNKPSIHQKIDFEKVLQIIGKALEKMLRSSEKLELTDQQYLGKKAFLMTDSRLFIVQKKSKKVRFDQDIDFNETLFENIDTAQNAFGVICDSNDKELCSIFVNNGDVYRLKPEELNDKELEFNSIIKSAEIE